MNQQIIAAPELEGPVRSETRNGMRIDWDVPLPMDDGLILRADLYRPIAEGHYPVIMSYGPYAKLLHFEDGYVTAWRKMVDEFPDVLANSSNRYIEIGGAAPKSAYLKIRERESYEYATVSAASALDLDGDVIRRARVALGSVAMRPWRLEETERRLVGQRLGSPAIEAAVDAGFADARPLSSNAYKIKLARNAALRTIELAGRA
jgi:CO dehydrogenase flavoprotein C-terminal domain